MQLVSAGLAIDAINNTINGNYEFAVVEAIASAYLQISKYYDKKIQRINHDFSDKIYKKYIPDIQLLTKRAEAIAKGLR